MKQMTKEELIEYFIKQLGDNEILGQVMSIEQIREKLNYIIKDVTYDDEIGDYGGHWRSNESGKGKVNFDKEKISANQESVVIVHELLHALSTTVVTLRKSESLLEVKEKCGLNIRSYFIGEHGKNNFNVENSAINEGMTDFLAEKITGVNHDGYNEEKGIYKILILIIDQDTLIKEAFGEKVNELESILKKELITKYGENVGTELNEQLKRMLTLSDQLYVLDRNEAIYGTNENSKKIYSQTKEELYNTLYFMIKSVLYRKNNLSDKIDMMIELEGIFDYRDNNLNEIRKLVSTNVLYELLHNDSMNYPQKIETIKRIKEQKINFTDDVIDEIFFGEKNFLELSIDEKIGAYINLQKGKSFTSNISDIVYQMYVENGEIIEDNFNKKYLISTVLQDIGIVDTVEKINKKLDESKYYKIGEYYALPRGGNPINTLVYDKEGKPLKKENLKFNPISAGEIADKRNIEALAKFFPEDKVKSIYEQLKERLKQYSSKDECADEMDIEVAIIGNMIRLYCNEWVEKTETNYCYMDFYSVDANGNLELIPKR